MEREAALRHHDGDRRALDPERGGFRLQLAQHIHRQQERRARDERHTDEDRQPGGEDGGEDRHRNEIDRAEQDEARGLIGGGLRVDRQVFGVRGDREEERRQHDEDELQGVALDLAEQQSGAERIEPGNEQVEQRRRRAVEPRLRMEAQQPVRPGDGDADQRQQQQRHVSEEVQRQHHGECRGQHHGGLEGTHRRQSAQ